MDHVEALGASSALGEQSSNVAFFRQQVVDWWHDHGRDFPWRKTADPYRILIAEMMLRRTQARQVWPVYRRFFERFPTVRSLAEAPEQDVADLLRPLGLAWRVP